MDIRKRETNPRMHIMPITLKFPFANSLTLLLIRRYLSESSKVIVKPFCWRVIQSHLAVILKGQFLRVVVFSPSQPTSIRFSSNSIHGDLLFRFSKSQYTSIYNHLLMKAKKKINY
jgi:hypothetical protein